MQAREREGAVTEWAWDEVDRYLAEQLVPSGAAGVQDAGAISRLPAESQ